VRSQVESSSPRLFVQAMPSQAHRAGNGDEYYNYSYQTRNTSPSIRKVPMPWPDERHVSVDQQPQSTMIHFVRQSPRPLGNAYDMGWELGEKGVVAPVYDGFSYVGTVLTGGVGRDTAERSLKPVSMAASTIAGGVGTAVTSVGVGIGKLVAFTAGVGSSVVHGTAKPVAEVGIDYVASPVASIGRKTIGAATNTAYEGAEVVRDNVALPLVSGISSGAENLGTAGATISSGFQSGANHGYDPIAGNVLWEKPQQYQPRIVPTSNQQYVAYQNPSSAGQIVYRGLVASPSDENYGLLDFANDYIATPLGFGQDKHKVGTPQVLQATPLQTTLPVQGRYIRPSASYVDNSGSGVQYTSGAVPS